MRKVAVAFLAGLTAVSKSDTLIDPDIVVDMFVPDENTLEVAPFDRGADKPAVDARRAGVFAAAPNNALDGLPGAVLLLFVQFPIFRRRNMEEGERRNRNAAVFLFRALAFLNVPLNLRRFNPVVFPIDDFGQRVNPRIVAYAAV